VPVSLHPEIRIVVEVLHVLHTAHFKAHICVFCDLRGVCEDGHHCADQLFLKLLVGFEGFIV
jgi:hypothetical protein